MTDDCKLLRLAAKAIGIQPASFDGMRLGFYIDGVIRNWNPLTDDGDALRLAVKLGLNVDVYRQSLPGEPSGVEVRGYAYRRSLAAEPAIDNGASLESATRRAIVRAAAEIGLSRSNEL